MKLLMTILLAVFVILSVSCYDTEEDKFRVVYPNAFRQFSGSRYGFGAGRPGRMRLSGAGLARMISEE